MDTDIAGDLTLIGNTPAKTMLYSLEHAAGGIGFYMNSNRAELMYLNKKEPSPLYMTSL